jgi:hypothetical protein
MLYVAVDIGCIECGEQTTVMGVFETREEAEATVEFFEPWRGGQHCFEVHEVPAIGTVVKP